MLHPGKLRLAASLLSSLFVATHAVPAAAALRSVSGVEVGGVLSEVNSGGPKQNVAYSLANGFPLWYQDANGPSGVGLKLALCLDPSAQRLVGGTPTTFFPCTAAEP